MGAYDDDDGDDDDDTCRYKNSWKIHSIFFKRNREHLLPLSIELEFRHRAHALLHLDVYKR